MPRFAMLEHDHPAPHFDLLLEVGDVLWTWRLDGLPQGVQPVPALRIGDHRPLYLEYEGPIGGGRGVVSCWDRGEFTWIDQTPTRLRLRLLGVRCAGILTLERVASLDWLAALDL